MVEWWVVLVSISFVLLIKAIHGIVVPASRATLPPGPWAVPLIGNVELVTTSLYDLPLFIRSLHAKFGPLVTLSLGSSKHIFVSDASIAYEALIQKGPDFADRPIPSITVKIASYNQYNINTAHYGPKWRLLRRNLTTGFLHSSSQISYSVQNKVLQALVEELSQSTGPVQVLDHFRRAMFFSLCLVCFGENIDYQQVMKLQRKTDRLSSNVHRFALLNAFPNISKILLRKQWAEFQEMMKDNDEAMLPFIQARRKTVQGKSKDQSSGFAYLDTLFNLSEKKEEVPDGALISLCFEFLVAATDSTSTTMQWILANLVKQQAIQEKLHKNIREIMVKDMNDETGEEKVIKHEELGKMKYVKAVVLETLRRHPPGPVLLPHMVTKDEVLAGHLVPKNSCIHFMVGEIGLDPKVWDEPLEFRPERFVNREFDLTGTKGIEMIPFGAGRRMCPGYAFAMEQLEFLVANLVWRFQFKEVEGVGVDLTEKREFTVGMKHPLQMYCVPRTSH